MSDQNDKPNSPLEVLRDGKLKIALFENRSRNGPFVSMRPGRLYEDGNGDLKETNSYNGAEALQMAKLMEQAYERQQAHTKQLRERDQGGRDQ